jgi:thiosulfate/3-mercaptopyruvate sulfurtransferase
MILTTLVNTETLSRHLDDPRWVVMDCRFVLTDPDAGQRAYAAGHIPGARYAHLDNDLCSPVTSASGRHPLPYPQVLAEKLGRWGIDKSSQVVVYDDTFGAMAARLWWLLRWLGHEAVALLDGGFPKWQREGRPVTQELPMIQATQFHPTINNAMWVDADYVEQMHARKDGVLIDARADVRFRGDVEPLDKVAGHIPGAINIRTKTISTLVANSCQMKHCANFTWRDEPCRARPGRADVRLGVTACHNILAMEHAGLAVRNCTPAAGASGSRTPAIRWQKVNKQVYRIFEIEINALILSLLFISYRGVGYER